MTVPFVHILTIFLCYTNEFIYTIECSIWRRANIAEKRWKYISIEAFCNCIENINIYDDVGIISSAIITGCTLVAGIFCRIPWYIFSVTGGHYLCLLSRYFYIRLQFLWVNYLGLTTELSMNYAQIKEQSTDIIIPRLFSYFQWNLSNKWEKKFSKQKCRWYRIELLFNRWHWKWFSHSSYFFESCTG